MKITLAFVALAVLLFLPVYMLNKAEKSCVGSISSFAENTERLTAKEVIEKNGGQVGYNTKPSLTKVYSHYAIVRTDDFDPGICRTARIAEATWTSGKIPDRIHFVFTNYPPANTQISAEARR